MVRLWGNYLLWEDLHLLIKNEILETFFITVIITWSFYGNLAKLTTPQNPNKIQCSISVKTILSTEYSYTKWTSDCLSILKMKIMTKIFKVLLLDTALVWEYAKQANNDGRLISFGWYKSRKNYLHDIIRGFNLCLWAIFFSQFNYV